MSTNINNPSDKRQYPIRWKMLPGKALFIEKNEKSSTGTETLLSVSHKSGIKPRNSSVTMFMAESLVGYKKCAVGDIAANTMWTWQGAIGVTSYEGVVSPAYYVYKQKADYYNPRYLDALLREKHLVDVYHSLSSGIRPSRLRLYPDQFLTIKFPVPLRTEQDQIVRYLDWQVSKINRLIVAKRRELDLYKEQMCKLFAEAKSENQKVRLKRVCDLIFDQVEIDPHDQYRKTGMYNRGRGIFRREQIQGNELGVSKFQHITRDCVMLSGQFAWEGAAYITTQADEEGIVSHRYYLLKPTRLTPEYIWAYLMSDEGLLHMQSCSHGSAGRNRPLNINELLNTYIPLPISDEAEQKVVSAVRILMYLNQQKDGILQLYEAMRTRLISDVVTGQIDVRDIEVPEYEVVEDADTCEEPEEDTEGEEYEE